MKVNIVVTKSRSNPFLNKQSQDSKTLLLSKKSYFSLGK